MSRPTFGAPQSRRRRTHVPPGQLQLDALLLAYPSAPRRITATGRLLVGLPGGARHSPEPAAIVAIARPRRAA